MIFTLETYAYGAFEHEEEFRALVEVLRRLSLAALREFGHVGLQALVLRGERQALEEVGGFGRIGTVGEAQALGGAYDGEGFPAAPVAEEIFQAQVEDHGDACQRGQGRHQFPVFQLREHGRREAGVPAEIDQGDLLAQAQLPQFPSDLVGGEDAMDGFGSGFGVG